MPVDWTIVTTNEGERITKLNGAKVPVLGETVVRIAAAAATDGRPFTIANSIGIVVPWLYGSAHADHHQADVSARWSTQQQK